MTNYDNSAKKNTIIPKVIESFQKAIPKKYTNISKKSSIQTLYRNTSSNIGKNVPDHRLMKELLQNFDEESIYRQNSNKTMIDHNEKTNNFKQKIDNMRNRTFKNKNMNKQDNCNNDCYGFNQRSNTITKINMNNTKKDNTAVVQIKHIIKGIDKMTSTTGLNVHNNQIQHTNYIHQELEEYPTKDVDQSITNKKPVKSKTKLNVNNKSSTVKTTRQREKSFVKEQVQKFNNISNNKLAKPYNNNHSNVFISQNKAFKNKRNIEDNLDTIKDQSRNYLNLMQSVRKSVPRIGRSGNRNDGVGADLNNVWSDHTTNTDYARNCVVKFPKETKYAMDQLREKNLDQQTDLTVLSNFGHKNYDHITPAINTRQCDRSEPVEEYNSKSIKTIRYCSKSPSVPMRKSVHLTNLHNDNNKGFVDKTHNRVSGIPVRRSSNRMYSNYVPCWRNLLCDRGDHKGPCS